MPGLPRSPLTGQIRPQQSRRWLSPRFFGVTLWLTGWKEPCYAGARYAPNRRALLLRPEKTSPKLRSAHNMTEIIQDLFEYHQRSKHRINHYAPGPTGLDWANQ